MFKMIANGIEVQMFVGICDFEYKEKQKLMVNVTLQGNPKFAPTHITECMDYSKVCNLIYSWENRKHVDLVETLLNELMDFVFKDQRVLIADIEILKPNVIPGTNYVGVGAYITREEYNTTYMIHLYEKYGYDLEYQFIEYEAENILFILSESPRPKVRGFLVGFIY